MPRGNGSGSKKPENRQKGRSSKGFNGSKIAFTSGLGVSAQGIGVRDRGLPSNQKAPTFSKKSGSKSKGHRPAGGRGGSTPAGRSVGKKRLAILAVVATAGAASLSIRHSRGSDYRPRPNMRSSSKEVDELVGKFSTDLKETLVPEAIKDAAAIFNNSKVSLVPGEGDKPDEYHKYTSGIQSYIAQEVAKIIHPANDAAPLVELVQYLHNEDLRTIGSFRKKNPDFKSIAKYVLAGKTPPGFSKEDGDEISQGYKAHLEDQAKGINAEENLRKTQEVIGGKYASILDKFSLFGICDLDVPENVFYLNGNPDPVFLDLDCSARPSVSFGVVADALDDKVREEIVQSEDFDKIKLQDLIAKADPEKIREATKDLREYVQTPEFEKVKEFVVRSLKLAHGGDSFVAQDYERSINAVKQALITQDFSKLPKEYHQYPGLHISGNLVSITGIESSDIKDAIDPKGHLDKSTREKLLKGQWVNRLDIADLIADHPPESSLSHIFPMDHYSYMKFEDRIAGRGDPSPDIKDPELSSGFEVRYGRDREF